MSNSILTEIACPNCLAPINLDGHGSSVTCDACQSKFVLEGHLCSHCSAYYKDGVAVCGRCGTPMTRHCRKCHTDNWAGDEYCKKCGSAMDLLDIATHSHQELTAHHQAERMSQIRHIRAQGEASSQKRMADLRQSELDRIAQLQERRNKKRRKDILNFVVIGIVLIIVVMILLFVFGSP